MMAFSSFPAHVQEMICEEVTSCEQVRWSEQPNPLRQMLPAFALWLFAIPWTAFALFWETAALGIWFGKTPDNDTVASLGIIMPIFGLPFVLIGLCMLATPFHIAAKAKRTYYIITNKRLIIICSRRTSTITSFDARYMVNLTRKECKDGSGDITFVEKNYIDCDGDKASKINGVYGVNDVRAVERMLKSFDI
jgi:hypothetical protein